MLSMPALLWFVYSADFCCCDAILCAKSLVNKNHSQLQLATMKKNTHFALTITAVSLLHIAGIWALSNFEDKPAELVAPQEELTFVELSSGAPAAAAAPTPVVQPKPEPKRERPPEPEIKRTIVKKPQENTVVERKPDPKPLLKPERKPEPERKPDRQPEQKPEQRQQPANNQALASNNQSKGNSPQGTGNSNNSSGKGSDGNKGGGDGKGAGGGSGDGPTTSVKIAGSDSCLRPDYPQESIDKGESGVARVRWVVGADGGIISVEVVGSSGSARLDKAALRKAKTCKFKPAMKGGVPVQNAYSRPYTFKINK